VACKRGGRGLIEGCAVAEPTHHPPPHPIFIQSKRPAERRQIVFQTFALKAGAQVYEKMII